MMKSFETEYLPKLPYIISIVSGKGGVGKSVITANFANQLSKKGMKVLVWDGDFHFPNLHLIFGVEPPVRAKDIYQNHSIIQKSLFKINENLDLLADYPAESVDDEVEIDPLIEIFKHLLIESDYDFIIIDTSAGVSEMMLNFANFSNSIMMIINDEPSTLLDCYALSKILLNFVKRDKIKILVNNVIDSDDFQEIHRKLSLVTKKFLKLEFEAIGFVPYSRIVRKSIMNQQLICNFDDEDITFYLDNLVNYYINEYNLSTIES